MKENVMIPNANAKARYAAILRERLKSRSPEQTERIDELTDEELIQLDALHTQRRVEAIRKGNETAQAARTKRPSNVPIVFVR
jgi:hypothetical protein